MLSQSLPVHLGSSQKFPSVPQALPQYSPVALEIPQQSPVPPLPFQYTPTPSPEVAPNPLFHPGGFLTEKRQVLSERFRVFFLILEVVCGNPWQDKTGQVVFFS